MYSIDSLSQVNEFNDYSLLNKHFKRSIDILDTILNNDDHQCALTRFDFCDYESKDGKTFGNINEYKPIVSASCGCNFHNTCLKSALAVRNYDVIKHINKNRPISFKCPSCNEKSSVTLLP